MKKKIFSLILSFVCIIACGFGLTGCRQMDRYLAVLPEYYDATLHYTLQMIDKYDKNTYTSDYEYDWVVKRIKDVEIPCLDNAKKDLIYVEYTYTNNLNHTYDYERTLLYYYNKNVGDGFVFRLNGTQWESYTGSFGDTWTNIYGSMNKAGSFVYEMTEDINGRDFPQNIKTETTNEYIEYDFKDDEEKFRISNNPYHVLLYYNFYNPGSNGKIGSHTEKVATMNPTSPNFTVPYLSTLTAEMLHED